MCASSEDPHITISMVPAAIALAAGDTQPWLVVIGRPSQDQSNGLYIRNLRCWTINV